MSRKKPLTAPPEAFSDEQKALIRAWCKRNHPQYMRAGPGGLKDLMDDMLLWHRQNDVERRDWVLTAYRWIKQQARIEYERAARYGRETPQMPRGKEVVEPRIKENTLEGILKVIKGGKAP